jgi:hypothetical protein
MVSINDPTFYVRRPIRSCTARTEAPEVHDQTVWLVGPVGSAGIGRNLALLGLVESAGAVGSVDLAALGTVGALAV